MGNEYTWHGAPDVRYDVVNIITVDDDGIQTTFMTHPVARQSLKQKQQESNCGKCGDVQFHS